MTRTVAGWRSVAGALLAGVGLALLGYFVMGLAIIIFP